MSKISPVVRRVSGFARSKVGLFKEVWEIDVGSSIEVSSDIVGRVRHKKLVKELGSLVLASATILRMRIKVKGVIASLREFTITNDFFTKVKIQRVKKAFPIVEPLNVSPNFTKWSNIICFHC